VGYPEALDPLERRTVWNVPEHLDPESEIRSQTNCDQTFTGASQHSMVKIMAKHRTKARTKGKKKRRSSRVEAPPTTLTVTTEPKGERQLAMTVQVNEERVQHELKQAARRLANQVRIPGFRPGRAPYNVLVQMLGKEALYEEFLDRLGNEIYAQALDQEGIEAYAEGILESVEFEPTLTYKFLVPLQPEVKLGDYRSLRVEEPEVQVDETEVETLLETLQERYAGYVEVDRPVEYGDLVSIDVKAVLLDEEGNETDTVVLEETDWDVTPDKETPMEPPGLDEALVGMKVGEEKDVVLSWPEDSQSMYAGKSARFHIKVRSIQAYQRPELNDEFAKMVDPEVESLEELKEKIREDLREAQADELEQQYVTEVLDKLVEMSELSYPPVAVEIQLDDILRQMDMDVRRMGFNGLEHYLQVTGKEYKEFREELREQAETMLRRNLVMTEIHKAEGITATDEEIEARIQTIAGEEEEEEEAEASRQGFMKMMRDQGRGILADQIVSEKTLDLVLAIARGEEVPPPGQHPPKVTVVETGEETGEQGSSEEAQPQASTTEEASEEGADEATEADEADENTEDAESTPQEDESEE